MAGSDVFEVANCNLRRWRYRKYLPLVFSEHDAIMAVTLLNSALAAEIRVHVVRVVADCEHLSTPPALAAK